MNKPCHVDLTRHAKPNAPPTPQCRHEPPNAPPNGQSLGNAGCLSNLVASPALLYWLFLFDMIKSALPIPDTHPWGNETANGELLNFCDANCGFSHKDDSINDGYEFTSPVGNYPAGASPYGALDMAGNVWEWVNDSWDSNYYENSPNENPLGPKPPKALKSFVGAPGSIPRGSPARVTVTRAARATAARTEAFGAPDHIL